MTERWGKGLVERRRDRGLRRSLCHVELRCRSRRADDYCRRPIGSSAAVRTSQTRSKDTRAEPRPGPSILPAQRETTHPGPILSDRLANLCAGWHGLSEIRIRVTKSAPDGQDRTQTKIRRWSKRPTCGCFLLLFCIVILALLFLLFR